jgi:hypothetical protein
VPTLGLHGRVVLVAEGGDGMGLATALRAAGAGAKVTLFGGGASAREVEAHDRATVARVLAHAGRTGTQYVDGDVANVEDLRVAISRTVAQLGALDAIVYAPAPDRPRDVHRCLAACLPHLGKDEATFLALVAEPDEELRALVADADGETTGPSVNALSPAAPIDAALGAAGGADAQAMSRRLDSIAAAACILLSTPTATGACFTDMGLLMCEELLDPMPYRRHGRASEPPVAPAVATMRAAWNRA